MHEIQEEEIGIDADVFYKQNFIIFCKEYYTPIANNESKSFHLSATYLSFFLASKTKSQYT
tara:strand:+ start:907 stop:1089 length:183 start_codon:yes stop_codon:yes gene_type:complete